ncbi:hypothetical protein FKP32DRAFT_435046 [Trametes sanguinea]|nr:hypothetical protein FKP32DRAFT_435046 [Trametes sanguinea]
MTAMRSSRVHVARLFECQAGSRPTRTSQRPHASLLDLGRREDGPVVLYILYFTITNCVTGCSSLLNGRRYFYDVRWMH